MGLFDFLNKKEVPKEIQIEKEIKSIKGMKMDENYFVTNTQLNEKALRDLIKEIQDKGLKFYNEFCMIESYFDGKDIYCKSR